MAMQDLFQALSTFKQGMQDLSISRSINGANDAVQQIRDSEMKDEEKRQALTNLSNQLVTRLSAQGAPVSQIQAVAGAIGPKQYANANQMNMDANLTGNQALAGQAKQQQDFESNKAFELARIKASQSPIDGAFKQAKFDEMQDQFKTKEFSKFSKTLDPSSEVRSSFGRGAQGLQRAQQLSALVGSAGDTVSSGNALPPQMIHELAQGLAAMVKGGVATEGEVKGFLPNTRGMDQASLEQYLTNNPAGANAGKFVQMYTKAISREQTELNTQIKDTVLRRATGNLSLYKRDPDLFKSTVAQELSLRGVQLNPEDIVVDGKRVTTHDMIQKEQDTKMALDGLKEAYQNRTSPKSQQIFKSLGVHPETPLNQALDSVKYKISRGML